MAASDIPRWMWEASDDFPFAHPPPGVTPNFENPHLVGYHSMTIACATCIGLLLVFGTARLWAKLRVIRTMSLDDYFFWMSLPLLLLQLCFYIYLDNNGAYGYHAWDFTLRSLTKPILVITFLQTILTPVTTWLIKVTLLCLILSAFKPVNWLRYLCYAGIVTAFAYYLTNFIVIIVSCHPREGTDRIAFLAGMASRQCAQTNGIVNRISIATGVFNLVSDLYILAIPIRAVYNLKITRKKKIGVFMIFSAGGMGCIASILSLGFRIRAFGDPDITVVGIPAMASNMVELSVGLIVACMAPISRLTRSALGKYFPSTSSKSGYSYKNFNKKLSEGRKRRHQPGGLSEIDSMKTSGTIISEEYTTTISSTETS